MQKTAGTLRELRVCVRSAFIVLCAISGLYACTDGSNPYAPAMRGPIGLALRPQFHILGGSGTSEEINFVRMVARDSASNTVLGTFEGPLASDAPSWNLGIGVDVPEGDAPHVIVTIELINITGGVETVEWSGATPPIVIEPGSTNAPTAEIPIYQGPPSNLAVTRVAITERTTSLLEGDSVRLHATAETTLPNAPHIFWSTLDPTVGVITDDGTVRPVRDGTMRVVAVAGPRSDTVVVTARQRAAGVVLTPDTLHASSIGEQVTFEGRVIDPRGNVIAGAALQWRATQASLEDAGNGRFRIAATGTSDIVAMVSTDTTIRAHGVVIAAQVPATVSAAVAAGALHSVGDTVSATAVVSDGNGVAIPGASITWTTSNAAVATVSASGKIQAAGNGQALITATAAGSSISGSVSVQVQQEPAALQLSATALSFATLARTSQLTPVARDARGNTIAAAVVQWTSADPTIATVSATGLVTARRNGTTQISAKSGAITTTAAVTVKQAVARLVVTPDTGSVAVGDSIAAVVAATDSSGAPVSGSFALTWSTSADSVARVTADGLVKGNSAGNAMITARSGAVAAASAITVTAANIHFASIVTSEPSLVEGGATTLTLHIRNLGNAPAPAARMSLRVIDAQSNAEFMQVGLDEPALLAGADVEIRVPVPITRDGDWPALVIFEMTGDATSVIRESVENDNVIRTNPIPVELLAASVTLLPDSVVLTSIGAQSTMTAQARTARGVAIARPVTWTSLQPDIATVTQAGVVTAVAGGTARIVAISDGRADTSRAIVRQRVARVTIGSARTLNFIGAFVNLTATVVDASDHPLADARHWRALDPAILGVDSAGRAVAVSNGTGRIVLQAGDVADTVTMIVHQVAASLTMSRATAAMAVGDTLRLTATALDSAGVTMSAVPAWSSTSTVVATVDAGGLILARSPGGTTINAQLGTLTASAAISVSAPDVLVSAIALSTSEITAGGSVTGIVSVRNAGGSAAGAAPVALRVLDASSGVILRDTLIAGIPLAAGATVTIPVAQILPISVAWPDSVRFEIQLNADHSIPDANASNDALRSAAVRVIFPVNAVVLSKHSMSFVSLGASDTSTVTLRDVHGRALTGRAVTYASRDASVATVTASGVISAAGNGDTRVIATAEGVSDSVAVHVEQVVASVVVAPSSITFHAIGRTIALTSAVTDARGNVVAGAPVTWSSADTMIASVDASGVVTSRRAGSTSVTATSAGHSATAVVNVAPVAASIHITSSTGSMLVGDTARFAASVADSSGAAVDAALTWTSSRPAVATVSTTGLVTGASDDTVTISVTAAGFTASSALTVTSAMPSSISADAPISTSGTVGEAVSDAPRVLVTDTRGRPVASAAVEWTLDDISDGPGPGPRAPLDAAADTVRTDASGHASFGWVLGTRAGHQHLHARIVGHEESVTFDALARAGSPVRGAKNRGGLTAEVSTTLSDVVEVQLYDRYENPVPDRTIVWTVMGGSSHLAGDLTTQTTVTDSAGKSSLTWSGFDTHAGLHHLRASVDGTSINIDIEKHTKHAAPHTGLKTKGGFTATVSTTLTDTVAVNVTDEFGNPADSVTVDWAVTGGNSVLPNGTRAYSTTTDALGNTSLIWNGFDTHAGSHHLRASIAGTPVDLDIAKTTKHAAPHTGLKTKGGFAATVSTTLADTVAVNITDEFGNPADSVTVDWAVTGGNSVLPNGTRAYSTTTDALGNTSLIWNGFDTHAGSHHLRASIAGTPVDLDIAKTTKHAAPHTGLKTKGGFTATVSTTLADTVAVNITDEFGNPADSVTVDWSVTGGNSALPGGGRTYSTMTDSLGNTSLIWNGFDTHAGSHHLRATIAGTPVDLDIAKTTKHAAAHSGSKTKGGLTAAVSATLSDTVAILVTDEFGNGVDNDTVRWTITGGSSRLPNDSAAMSTITDALGNTSLIWSGFSTRVATHSLRATINGTPVDVTVTKATKPGKLKHLNLSADTVTLTSIDEEYEVTTSPVDDFGNAITLDSVIWTPADTTVEVESRGRGKVKAKNNGQTTVTATGVYDGDSLGESVIVRVAQAVDTASGITITGLSTLPAGVSSVFTGAGVDANGKAVKRWNWSVAPRPGDFTHGSAEIVGSPSQLTVTIRGLTPGWVDVTATDPKTTTSQVFHVFITGTSF